MAVPLEAEGGEHKALRKQIKQLKKAASSGELDAAGAAELKALKKKAKALKGSGEAASAGEEQQQEEKAEQEEQQQAGGKKEKKKKRKDGAAAPAAAPAAAAEQQQDAPPAKKKQKKAAAAAVDASGGMAAVGDRQLAATRPALVKALYIQHADVAGTSAAVVDAWREERQTKVEGLDLNPITAFSQSSEWPALLLVCLLAWLIGCLPSQLQAGYGPPHLSLPAHPALTHCCPPTRSALRPVCQGAARHAHLPAPLPHPGPVPAHRPERARSDRHRRHRLWQDPGLWPAGHAAHQGAAGGGGHHRWASQAVLLRRWAV